MKLIHLVVLIFPAHDLLEKDLPHLVPEPEPENGPGGPGREISDIAHGSQTVAPQGAKQFPVFLLKNREAVLIQCFILKCRCVDPKQMIFKCFFAKCLHLRFPICR